MQQIEMSWHFSQGAVGTPGQQGVSGARGPRVCILPFMY